MILCRVCGFQTVVIIHISLCVLLAVDVRGQANIIDLGSAGNVLLIHKGRF